MEVQYRLAKMADLDAIGRLVGRVIDHMEAERIFQWDELYPNREDFADDIGKNELYVGVMGEVIVVIYTLNGKCDEEYRNGRWRYTEVDYRVIHRLCVDPEYQRRGIAGYTLSHIENELRKAKVEAVRLDVFSGNPFAQRLYTNAGYERVGFADWRKGRFFLMEKGLNQKKCKGESSMSLFYTPENAKTGDVIPFYNEETKRFENYYLKNWSPDVPEEEVVRGWHRIVTEDNRNFDEMPIYVTGGTGSVLKVDDTYHMFYCTFDFDKDPVLQWARHATSKDLVHWDDIPEDKFGPDGEIYRTSDWRDPHVFWNEEEQQWWMLLAARENAATERNGCVALCVSDDLSHWEYRDPLYAPRMNQGANECPDLFKMGDWYYLVYSNYTDGLCTYYRMSRSSKGPWIRPKLDTFDGRAFYAGKTASDGKDRYIYGWNPTKGENSWGFDPGKDFGLDYQSWNWGGTIVVHKLIQHGDGTLGVCPVDSVANAFGKETAVEIKGLTGNWEKKDRTVSCLSEEGYAASIADKIPPQCCIKAKLKYYGEPTRFGLALQVDEAFDFGYYLMFEPDHRRIQFRSGLRMYEHGGQMFPYAVEMERPLLLEAGREYDLALYIQDSIGLLYVDDDLAFGFRMYNWKERHLGFFVSEGGLEIRDAVIMTEEE